MKRAKKRYGKLNHLQIAVRDAVRSRDWYVKNVGLKVEFEVPENGFVALEDDRGMALLINRGKPAKGAASGFAIYFEVEDVDARYRTLKGKRVKFVHEPEPTVWGYGPELLYPDGVYDSSVRLSQHREVAFFRLLCL
jgi:catechol 2,3-dioxygenase-like lactoylglutathione lyase family enzyme